MAKQVEWAPPLCESEDYLAFVEEDSVIIARVEGGVRIATVPLSDEDAGLTNFIAHAVTLARRSRQPA